MDKDKSLNKTAFKAGTFFIVSQILVRGLSFLVVPFYSRFLTTEQFGLFKVFESWLLILVPVVSLGLYRSVEVALYDYKDEFANFTSNIVFLGAILFMLFSGLCLILRKRILVLLGFTDWMLYIALLYIFTEFVYMCFMRREKQLMRYKKSFAYTVIVLPMSTLISVMMMLYVYYSKRSQSNMLFCRIAGYYIPVIIAGLVLAILMMKKIKWSNLLTDWRYGLLFSIPLVFELVSIQTMNQIDKIMIQRMVGNAESGIYSMATTVSFIVWVLEDSVWSAWQPWLFTKISTHEENDIKKSWQVLMHTFGVISLFLVSLSPEIILIFGGQKYKMAMYIVAPLVCSTLFRFYSYSYSALQNFYKKTIYVSIGTCLVMFINIVVNYFGIKYYGYIAAAYATAFSYLMLLLIMAFFEKKIIGTKIFPLSKTFLISLIYFILCVFIIFTYDLNIIFRYVMITVIMFVFIVFNYRKIFRLVSALKKK